MEKYFHMFLDIFLYIGDASLIIITIQKEIDKRNLQETKASSLCDSNPIRNASNVRNLNFPLARGSALVMIASENQFTSGRIDQHFFSFFPMQHDKNSIYY